MNDILESKERQRIRNIKLTAIEQCQLGYIITKNISKFINGEENGQVLRPWDLYPDLLKEERELYEIEREKEEFEAYKERRKAYAKAVNEKRKEV